MSNDPNAHSRAIEAAHKVMIGFGPPKRGITITEDTVKAMQKEVEVHKYVADNYRRLLDESDHAYATLEKQLKDASVAAIAEAVEVDRLTVENAALRAELDKLKQQEPVAYLAWRDGKPCYEGDDAVCEDAVWPVDHDDARTSMPVYLVAGV